MWPSVALKCVSVSCSDHACRKMPALGETPLPVVVKMWISHAGLRVWSCEVSQCGALVHPSSNQNVELERVVVVVLEGINQAHVLQLSMQATNP